MLWPGTSGISPNPIGCNEGLHSFSRYLRTLSFLEYKFMIVNGTGDFFIIYSIYVISDNPPIKYTLFIIPRHYFSAIFNSIFLINYVPREYPIKLMKCPLKFFITNSARYSPVFLADLKAGLKGFE